MGEDEEGGIDVAVEAGGDLVKGYSRALLLLPDLLPAVLDAVELVLKIRPPHAEDALDVVPSRVEVGAIKDDIAKIHPRARTDRLPAPDDWISCKLKKHKEGELTALEVRRAQPSQHRAELVASPPVPYTTRRSSCSELSSPLADSVEPPRSGAALRAPRSSSRSSCIWNEHPLAGGKLKPGKDPSRRKTS